MMDSTDEQLNMPAPLTITVVASLEINGIIGNLTIASALVIIQPLRDEPTCPTRRSTPKAMQKNDVALSHSTAWKIPLMYLSWPDPTLFGATTNDSFTITVDTKMAISDVRSLKVT